MKVIVVSGTPGTGKTIIAKKLAKKLKAKYIDINRIVKENQLDNSYDKERTCYVVDIKKLNKVLINLIKESKENLVIDGHLAHFLPREYVDEVIICKTTLRKLKNRLKKRGYNKNKIRENLDAEIFDICFNEAKEKGHKVEIIET